MNSFSESFANSNAGIYVRYNSTLVIFYSHIFLGKGPAQPSFIALPSFTVNEVIHLISASHVINKTNSWRRTMLVILDGLGLWAQVETRGAGAARVKNNAKVRETRHYADTMAVWWLLNVYKIANSADGPYSEEA
jgi:hypothetical protein